jgi:hypothetical protein
MFFQLLFIHLFRPFLKYTLATSPLPPNVSPRKLCTQAAAMISKLMRLYKRSHGLRQICNIAVYIAHSACTIHLLNLPDKNARRDIVHGVKHLEEIAEGWLCARRTLGILSVLARKWNVELPNEAAAVLARTDAKFGNFMSEVAPASRQRRPSEQMMSAPQFNPQNAWQNPAMVPTSGGFGNGVPMAAAGQAQSGAPVRTNSGNFAMPPDDANGLRAQQYPSAAATPSSAPGQGHGRGRGSFSSRTGGSPSDMFGGIEQLIRDSTDWIYRDQHNLAMGFENWNGMEGIDPGTWAANNAATGTSGMVNSSAVGVGAGATNLSMPTYATNNAVTTTANGNQGLPMDWMNSLQAYNTMAVYNEDEWYQ